MNDRIEGIILSQKDYRENSSLITILTNEYGKLTLVARGTKKINSKYGGSILPFIKGEFLIDYVDNKSMFTMKSMKVVSFRKIFYQDLFLQSLASICCECSEVLVNDALDLTACHEIYCQLDKTLEVLETEANSALAVSLYISFLLKILGIAPEVDCCVNCQSLTVNAISISEGGFLCDKCRSNLYLQKDDIDLLKNFRYVCKADITNFETLSPIVTNSEQVLQRLINFLEYHIGIKIRSFAFYNKLCAID